MRVTIYASPVIPKIHRRCQVAVVAVALMTITRSASTKVQHVTVSATPVTASSLLRMASSNTTWLYTAGFVATVTRNSAGRKILSNTRNLRDIAFAETAIAPSSIATRCASTAVPPFTRTDLSDRRGSISRKAISSTAVSAKYAPKTNQLAATGAGHNGGGCHNIVLLSNPSLSFVGGLFWALY